MQLKKERDHLIKVLFKAYMNLKNTRNIVNEMIEKRKILQDIGRDFLTTNELIHFIDWRNERIEKVKGMQIDLTHLLHEILNLNHLFDYMMTKNNDKDKMMQLNVNMLNISIENNRST